MSHHVTVCGALPAWVQLVIDGEVLLGLKCGHLLDLGDAGGDHGWNLNESAASPVPRVRLGPLRNQVVGGLFELLKLQAPLLVILLTLVVPLHLDPDRAELLKPFVEEGRVLPALALLVGYRIRNDKA